MCGILALVMIVVSQLILQLNLNTQKIRKCAELNRLLNEKVNKMKSILVINNVLTNSYIKENIFSNDILFTTNEGLPKTTDSSLLTS